MQRNNKKYMVIFESGQYLSLPGVVLALGLACLPPCKSENQSEDLWYLQIEKEEKCLWLSQKRKTNQSPRGTFGFT